MIIILSTISISDVNVKPTPFQESGIDIELCLVMGSGQKFLTWVGSGQFLLLGSGKPFMVWVWIWKISPENVKFFNFFHLGSKKILSGQKVPGSKDDRPLIYCGSKVSSGWVGSGPISTYVWHCKLLLPYYIYVHMYRLSLIAHMIG